MLRALGLVALTACSIPDGAFRATIDGGDTAGSDASNQPQVLAIVSSTTAVDVDEGAAKDLTVALSQAPSGPLTVSIATTATTKLGISVPTLAFTPSNFREPQTVTLSGLTDADTGDEHADVTLTAPGVDPVTVSATVHDVDQLQIITSGSSPLTIQEGSMVTVNVHLSAQPAGDVAVTALLGPGPVTVSPSMRVFTAADYDVDQTFTFSAAIDPDTHADDQALTFRATDLPDKLITIHAIDINSQNILVQVNPANATITEQTTQATLEVSLSQKPSANVIVTISNTTGAAHASDDQLMFTPQNYATKQTVTIDGVEDQDTANTSDTIKLHAPDPDDPATPLDRTVVITVKDDDVQQILENAPAPLAVTETTTATFDATLKFKPAANVVVSVVSLNSAFATASPGTLTFTPTDYNQAHTVTVTGAHDNNLAPNATTIRLSQAAIGTTDVAVNVADVDHQSFVLSATSVTVTEGTSRKFDVSLAFDPGATVTVAVDNDNQVAFPSTPASISFTGGSAGNWATPVPVTMTPPIDKNDVAETARFSISSMGATGATVTATMVDPTVVASFGFPPPAFSSSVTIAKGTVLAIRVPVPVTTRLDALGIYIPAGVGDFRMALYGDDPLAPGGPGPLIAAMPIRQAISAGANLGNLLPDSADPTIPVGVYWIAIRLAQSTAIGMNPSATSRDCFANVSIQSLDADWPNPFGAHGCQDDNMMNLWINTYHQ